MQIYSVQLCVLLRDPPCNIFYKCCTEGHGEFTEKNGDLELTACYLTRKKYYYEY